MSYNTRVVSEDCEEIRMVIERAKPVSLMDLISGTVSHLCVVFILFAAFTAWLMLGDLSLWLFVHSG